MKKVSYFMLTLLTAFILSPLFSTPQKAKASDPSYPDQGCVNGVNNTGLYTWADSSPTVVFTPTFNWLNAVSVRIKGTNPTGTPKVQAQIWNWHSAPHRMLASHTVELDNRTSEYWQYITESSQDMDPGLQYALVLVSKDGTLVYWSATTNTSCYSRGYAMHDGAQDLSLMYGFSTYGWYDPNNPNSDGTLPGSGSTGTGNTGAGAPVADPAGNNPSGVASSSSGSSGTSGSGTSTTGGSGTPSDKDIAALLADYKSGGTGFGDLVVGILFGPFTSMIIWPILSLLFWVGVIVLIIVLIRRHNKKKAAAAAVPAKAEEKPKEEKK